MVNIIYSSLWLIAFILLAIFTGRINTWFANRQSRKTGKAYFNPYWNGKMAVNLIRIGWGFFAFNAAIGLVYSIIATISSSGASALSNSFKVYRDSIYPFLLLAFAGYYFYFFTKALRYSDPDKIYAPFIITNSTNRPLTIYARGRSLGRIKPGEQVFNNDLLTSHSTYLMKAKDSEGNIVFHKEFSSQELKDLDWRVIISSLDA